MIKIFKIIAKSKITQNKVTNGSIFLPHRTPFMVDGFSWFSSDLWCCTDLFILLAM